MNVSQESAKRLFFALWPPDDLRRELEHETRPAARHSGGRVIPAANLHVTLAFLGSVPEHLMRNVHECKADIGVTGFELVLGALEWWPRQELLCLEPISGGEELGELVSRLHASLRRRGFELERRPFRAHMTLARDVRRAHEFKPIRQLHWQVHGIEVIESKTGAKGSTYSVVSGVPPGALPA